MRHISLRLLTLSLVMLGPMGVCAAQDGGDAARASAQTLDGASAQAVDIAVDLTERLAVKDWDSEQVRVESTSGGQAAPDCAVGVRQTGKTIEITQRADSAGACSAAMDLTVLVPRRYDVSITAKVAREVRVQDIAGTVTGEANPRTSLYGGSHQTTSMQVNGSRFQIEGLRGDFVLSVADVR